MSVSRCRRWLAIGLALGVFGWFSASTHAQNAEAILVEEGFEGSLINDPFCREGGCEVPQGWGVWFVPADPQRDAPGIHLQPRYAATNTARSGAQAQRVWVENGTFTGGLYRIVNDVKVGARLRLTAWGRVWSTNDDSPISSRPSRDIRIRIGIDPLGGDGGKPSPLSGQVTWSSESGEKDKWVEFSVETEARASTVVLFLYGSMRDAVRHNEVYWDDVRLEVIAPAPTPTPETAQPSPNASPEVPATAEAAASPSDAVTYTVKAGDTLFSIALAFNTTVEELLRHNPSVRPETLQIGQDLVIKPATAPTPTPAAPTPEPTPDPFANAQPGQPIEIVLPTPTTGALCVQAFFDDNGNGRREDIEDLVPNISFEVIQDATPIGSYVTTGIEEPFCFENLLNGTYIARATVVDIYNATSPLDDKITVAGGRSFFSVGLRRRQDGSLNLARPRTSSATTSPLDNIRVEADLSLAVLAFAVVLTTTGLTGLLVMSWVRRNRI